MSRVSTRGNKLLPQQHIGGVRADGNADLREHSARLLSAQYRIEAVGAMARRRQGRRVPSLVLSDVMMPRGC